MEKKYTTKEFALKIGVSRSTLYRWKKTGQLVPIEIGGKGNTSVLVLDNPFGPISSKHMLEPMFAISRNYRVQMICLSDLSKSDIVSCFDLVIRAVVRKMSLSTREQLTHEGDEAIEHGFYRSEQMNLF